MTLAANATGREPERCHAGKDGDCVHRQCPQLRDGEPAKTGRHCPLDVDDEEDDRPLWEALHDDAWLYPRCDGDGMDPSMMQVRKFKTPRLWLRRDPDAGWTLALWKWRVFFNMRRT